MDVETWSEVLKLLIQFLGMGGMGGYLLKRMDTLHEARAEELRGTIMAQKKHIESLTEMMTQGINVIKENTQHLKTMAAVQAARTK